MVLFSVFFVFFFFKQKTAYEMRISDWSSDVCSSDLDAAEAVGLEGLDFDRIAGHGGNCRDCALLDAVAIPWLRGGQCEKHVGDVTPTCGFRRSRKDSDALPLPLSDTERSRAARCARALIRPPGTSLRAPALRSAQCVQASGRKAVAAGRDRLPDSRKELAAEAAPTTSRGPESRGLDSPPAPYNPPMTNGWFDQLVAWIGAHPLAAGLVIIAIAFCDEVIAVGALVPALPLLFAIGVLIGLGELYGPYAVACAALGAFIGDRSEEHTSELQSLMRISSAVFCLKKKRNSTNRCTNPNH